MNLLTKSKYLSGLECPRNVWIGLNEETKKQVRDNPLEYCELDTLAEVVLADNLREIVG